MVKRPVDLTETVPMELNVPGIEIIHFTTQSTDGDWYDTKKITNIKGAFASNLTTADKNIQVSWAIQSNGQMRVTLVPEEASTSGYLLIVGRK